MGCWLHNGAADLERARSSKTIASEGPCLLYWWHGFLPTCLGLKRGKLGVGGGGSNAVDM